MKPLSEIKINKTQISQLSANLRALMIKHSKNENDLAKLLEMPVMTVRRIVSGETIDPRISTLKMIADYFNVPIDHLIQSEHQPRVTIPQNQPTFIPILDWQTIAKLNSLEELDRKTWKSWHTISTSTNHILGQNSFALPSKPTMQPRFPLGTLFVIDPSVKELDGDLVIIKIKDEISLRELIIDPPNKILQPIIQGSTAVPFNSSEHLIVGIVVLTVFYNRQSV